MLLVSHFALTIASQWKSLLLQYPPSIIEFFGTLIIQLAFFWVTSAIYTSLPFIFPAFSARHKLQKQEKQPTLPELWDCFKTVSRNQVFSTLIHIALLTLHLRLGKQPAYRFDPALPGPQEILRDIAFAIFVREIVFYYIHRLFHHPSLYPKIHKPHHRFTAPVALAAQYATLTEHLLANVFPIVLPPMIIRSHIVTFWIFLAIELAETTAVHSGFDFLGKSARAHDSHHEKFMVHFGTVGLLDWIHGTDEAGRAKAKAKLS